MFVFFHIYLPKVANFDNPANHSIKYQDIIIETEDNLTLKGWYIPSSTNKGTILVCHGVVANRADVLRVTLKFHNAGYEVYTFDFRGHGESDNAKVTYGFTEKRDIKAIVNYIKSRGVKQLGAYGLSMGAAILLLSMQENPEISPVIADSSFASVEKIMNYRLAKIIPSPLNKPMVALGKLYTKIFYGVDIDQIAPIEIVNIINRPIMFIVGTADTNITPDNGNLLYERANDPKELFVVKGADHTQTIDSPDFDERTLTFISKYLNKEKDTIEAAQ
ncbi:MAG: alpha/beta hydrolase [Cyanobacteriota bacterium]